MHAKLRRPIFRTVVIITASSTLLLVSCTSDSNSSTAVTGAGSSAATTATTATTATDDTVEPPGNPEDCLAVKTGGAPPATDSTTATTTATSNGEGMPADMQACLDRLAGTISAAYDLCPPSGGQPVPVLWMRNKMLVSAADVAAATRALNSLPVDGVSDVTEYLDGAGNTAFGLFEATVTGMKVDKEFMDNLEKANIDSRSQGGPLMSLNFVYSVSQVWRFHPYGAPDEVPEAEAPALPAAGSGGPTIDVFDSLYPTNPLLTPNWPGPSENATTLAYPSTRPTTPYPAYGHGPFVTSLIKRSAPTANVRAFGIAQNVDTQGVFITTADVQAAMSAAFGQVNDPTVKPQFTGPVPDIVNLSLGGPGCGVTAPAPLGEFLNRAATPGEWSLDLTKAPVIVAAAGNSSAKVEDYPAAFSEYSTRPTLNTTLGQATNPDLYPELEKRIVAVGSMSPGATVPDCFSNVGDWINIWAAGKNQVSYYPYGSGWAKWSGTSFSAAQVSAMLARQASAATPVEVVWTNLLHGATPPVANFPMTQIATPPTACPN